MNEQSEKEKNLSCNDEVDRSGAIYTVKIGTAGNNNKLLSFLVISWYLTEQMYLRVLEPSSKFWRSQVSYWDSSKKQISLHKIKASKTASESKEGLGQPPEITWSSFHKNTLSAFLISSIPPYLVSCSSFLSWWRCRHTIQQLMHTNVGVNASKDIPYTNLEFTRSAYLPSNLISIKLHWDKDNWVNTFCLHS